MTEKESILQSLFTAHSTQMKEIPFSESNYLKTIRICCSCTQEHRTGTEAGEDLRGSEPVSSFSPTALQLHPVTQPRKADIHFDSSQLTNPRAAGCKNGLELLQSRRIFRTHSQHHQIITVYQQCFDQQGAVEFLQGLFLLSLQRHNTSK